MSLTPQDLENDLRDAMLAHRKDVADAVEYFSVHARAARQDGNPAKATALLKYAEALEESMAELSRVRNEMIIARCTRKQGETQPT